MRSTAPCVEGKSPRRCSSEWWSRHRSGRWVVSPGQYRRSPQRSARRSAIAKASFRYLSCTALQSDSRTHNGWIRVKPFRPRCKPSVFARGHFQELRANRVPTSVVVYYVSHLRRGHELPTLESNPTRNQFCSFRANNWRGRNCRTKGQNEVQMERRNGRHPRTPRCRPSRLGICPRPGGADSKATNVRRSFQRHPHTQGHSGG